jgi:deazaflavin-dependent oxidoreductase (nitroreductase family)
MRFAPRLSCAVPIPRAVAPFNKRVLNHLTSPFARYLPGLAVVTHVGRKSGRAYRTPVNVFRRGGSYLFVMTYGPDADWVKNVEAAGACDIETRGRTIHLAEPRRFTDPTRREVPGPVRLILRLIEVDEFMMMRSDLVG